MRASLKTTIAASLAMLILGLGAASAEAKIFKLMPPHPHWHHGFGWGRGFAFGAFGAAIAADAAYDSCVRYRPMYDANGNYIGRQAINVCY